MGSRDACKETYEMVREYEIYIYIVGIAERGGRECNWNSV